MDTNICPTLAPHFNDTRSHFTRDQLQAATKAGLVPFEVPRHETTSAATRKAPTPTKSDASVSAGHCSSRPWVAVSCVTAVLTGVVLVGPAVATAEFSGSGGDGASAAARAVRKSGPGFGGSWSG
ncbi:unnamed protein product, partial [Discosporangium mesarthrocarpum]